VSPRPRRWPGVLLDANVLIDFLELDPGLLPLLVAAHDIVVVPDVVVDEVEALDEERARRVLGLTIEHATADDVREAGGRRWGLSFVDLVCLSIARRRALACVTNDVALRRACGKAGVEVAWGLEALERLAEGGLLPVEEAIRHARQLVALAGGRLRPEMVSEFERRLGR